MKTVSLTLAAAAMSVAAVTAAFAAELPSYEANGFPASSVQVRLLGAAHLTEQAAATTAPSPHQVSVLAPRAKVKTATTAPVTTGTAR
ncbi:hypothetical protein NLM33_04710 [Bradyrhizobium sp. CCGUVB1N3]|uniref:hypothetical protein n=1 Tax=Bradyrhizobium sp. CCGUVB1N3 TaxID=2949629 RepID=UPI0020B3B618|nr:hypothetical protein [Bradyrhizobium sp. CCGUVB1N3]MCP3469630.1 hypothetical protein [Bradyrhizobium sp. CCGUVB1N3]